MFVNNIFQGQILIKLNFQKYIIEKYALTEVVTLSVAERSGHLG